MRSLGSQSSSLRAVTSRIHQYLWPEVLPDLRNDLGQNDEAPETTVNESPVRERDLLFKDRRQFGELPLCWLQVDQQATRVPELSGGGRTQVCAPDGRSTSVMSRRPCRHESLDERRWHEAYKVAV